MIYTINDIGCYVDGCRGHYMGVEIQNFAVSAGWEGWDIEGSDPDSDTYDAATDDAIDYLNTRCSVGVYFGYENGDFGLWQTFEGDDDE